MLFVAVILFTVFALQGTQVETPRLVPAIFPHESRSGYKIGGGRSVAYGKTDRHE